MTTQSLKNKTIKAMAWSSVSKMVSYFVNFIIGIILARLLMPSDFGLIGMLAVFFAISQLFVESGFSNALIQKIDRTNVDFSTIFYFNIIVSTAFYIILFISAPYIAQFYKTPELTLLTRVLGLNILIAALTIVQQTRLSIDMNFKTISIIGIVSIIISGILGVSMAYQGFGVWALVIQSLSASIIRMFLLFYYNKWKPLFVFSKTSIKQLFRFSSNLLIAGFVATIVNNLYSMLIGKIFNSTELGFYTRSKTLPELLSNTISSVLQSVTYPILTSLQNDKDRMVSVYGRIMRIIVFFVIPLLTLFAIMSEPFVRLILTEKWISIVPLIQWLCFARMITPISSLNMNILNAIGRSDLFLKVDISKLPLAIVALIITVPFGLKAVVIGHFVLSFISFFINSYYPGKLFNFGAMQQIREMRTVIIATIIMSISVLGVLQILPGDLLKLTVGSIFAGAVYLLSAYLLKIEEFNEVKKVTFLVIEKIKEIKK